MCWIFVAVFGIGMVAFPTLFSLSWVDSFHYTCTTISTIEPIPDQYVVTTSQKVFVGLYSLICGLFIIVLAWYIVEMAFLDEGK